MYTVNSAHVMLTSCEAVESGKKWFRTNSDLCSCFRGVPLVDNSDSPNDCIAAVIVSIPVQYAHKTKHKASSCFSVSFSGEMILSALNTV